MLIRAQGPPAAAALPIHKEIYMKKTFALALAALLALTLTACTGAAPKKPDRQITIYADAALEAVITGLAKAYTTPSTKEDPNPYYYASSEVLLKFGASGELKQELDGGAYCDLFIPAGAEFLGDRDFAGPSALTLSPADDAGVVYQAALLNRSDRREAALSFLDYFATGEAGDILASFGFVLN